MPKLKASLLAIAALISISGCVQTPSSSGREASLVDAGALSSDSDAGLVDAASVVDAAAPQAATKEASPEPEGALTMSRNRCEAAGCELVFSFSRPMMRPGKVKSAKQLPIQIVPGQAGTWRWKSTTELSFKPKKGALHWGHRYEISLAEAVPLAGEEFAMAKPFLNKLRVPYFQVAGKVASWPVVQGKPRFVAFLDQYNREIGRKPVYLVFDQPVSPALVQRKVTATVDAKNQRIRVERPGPGSLARVWSEAINVAPVAAVFLKGRPDDGAKITLTVPESLKQAEGETASRDYIFREALEVKSLTLQKKTDGGRAPLQSSWRVEFNTNVNPREAKKRVRITPKPERQSVSAYGRSMNIRATLKPGVRYSVTIAAGMTDILGNRLQKAVRNTVVAQDLVPRLELPTRNLVLERLQAQVPVRATNLQKIRLRAHPIADLKTFIQQLADDQHDCVVPPSTAFKEVRARVRENEKVLLGAWIPSSIRGPVCVEASAISSGSEALTGPLSTKVVAQITDLGLTAKVQRNGISVWVTRLSNTKPVVGATVMVVDPNGKTLATARTGVGGIAELSGEGLTARGDVSKAFIVAKTSKDLAVTEISNRRVSQPWQFGLDGDLKTTEKLTAAVFTDRGVYRPKEEVHIKFLVRKPDKGPALIIPKDREITVHISDPRGQSVATKKLALDDHGAADTTITLANKAGVGKYTVRVTHGGAGTSRHFRVEEYRVPTFEVKLKSDQKQWSDGEDARLSVAANYLHGGGLAGRNLRFDIKRDTIVMQPPQLKGFVFHDAAHRGPTGLIRSGEKRLDGQGKFALSFRPTHPVAAGPMRYVVDAYVTDVDRQAYAGRLSKVVHPSDIYVGIRPPKSRVLAKGEELKIATTAIGTDGSAKPGTRIKLVAEAIEYHTTTRAAGESVQRDNRAVRREVTSCSLKSTKAATSCALRINRAGHYKITASTRDSKARRVSTSFTVTIGGKQRTPWPRFDHERIEIIADKDSYEPGDVAQLAIQTPFKSARGILSLEQGDVIEHRFFEVKSDSPVLKIPIKAVHAPNIFASVVLLRGRMHRDKDALGFETGAPGFRIGYTELKVSPRFAKLDVGVTLDKKVAKPQGRLGIDLLVTDSKGRPAPGQATVMVVDEAVLGLTGFKTPNALSEIYAARPLGVRTASSRLDLPHSRRSRKEALFPGGGGDDWDEENEDDLSELPNLRSLFKSTVYWNPTVVVDKQGKAHIDVNLPDNVTTFRVMAVVADRQGRAGSADNKILVRKPVMVKAVVPRFAHPGDTLTVQARVFNGTSEPGVAQVVASFEGMKLSGDNKQSLKVAASSSSTFSFPLKVTGRKEAVIRFATTLGNASDAVEIRIPILNPGSRRKQVETRTVGSTGKVDLHLPKTRIAGTTRIEVTASSTSLSKLGGAVDYLMKYPNGCIEQTTSTAYPLIVLEDLLPEMGITVDKAKLKEFASAGVKRLLGFQTTAGGLAYWPGSDKPHAFGTAFGLTALIEAKDRGYTVPDKSLARMASYLEQELRSGKITDEMPHGGMADADTRALFVMTLGRLDRHQHGYVATLWGKRDKMTAFGLSFLAVAISEGTGESALLGPVLDEIRKRAVEKNDEAYFDGDRDQGWSMGSPLRTHGAALLAFASSNSKENLSPKLLNGLLGRQQGGLWGNTQENVFGIMAVAKAVGGAGAGAGSGPKFELSVGGKKISNANITKVTKQTRRFTADDSAGPLDDHQSIAVKNDKKTPLIITVRAEYDQTLGPQTMNAVDKGFAVERSYETLKGASLAGKTIPLGDLIVARVRITTTKKYNYVAIADRLPAGLEPLNTALATTQKVSKRKASASEKKGLGVLSYNETRDERVAFYADDLPAGTYEFTYLARATTPGTFWRPAAQADAMYDPDATGTSTIDKVVIK